MYLRKIAILLSIFMVGSITIYAQAPNLFHFNTKNGLTSNHVYFTNVDKLGYLWIGTADGLFRYNGYSFIRYGYADGLTKLRFHFSFQLNDIFDLLG